MAPELWKFLGELGCFTNEFDRPQKNPRPAKSDCGKGVRVLGKLKSLNLVTD